MEIPIKAVVWHRVGDIRMDDVPEPQIREPADSVIRLTSSAICGTDLHFVRGSFADMKEGRILRRHCRTGRPSCPQSGRAGTAFFGGPEAAGGFDGLQAEKARIPYANIGLVKLPDEVSDEQAILISDIFPCRALIQLCTTRLKMRWQNATSYAGGDLWPSPSNLLTTS